MKILLTSIGTRGDMEPFLAIAELLKAEGHEVICLFPGQFRSMAEESGFRFASLGDEFLEMLHSKEGKALMGNTTSGLRKIAAYIKLAKKFSAVNKAMLRRQYEVIEEEKPDRVVHNGKAIYPVIWGLEHPGKVILVSPIPYLIHPVKEQAHVVFNKNFGPFLNKLTYGLANFGLIQTIMKSVKWLEITSGIKRKQIQQALMENKTIYTISPSVFSRPDYWPEHVKVLGYHERNKAVNWQPDAALQNFLARHEKVLLVTFGSMSNPEPEEKTRIIVDILQKHQIPALINTAGGGLVVPENYDEDLLHFVDQIPYDWAFPKMYGVIHHGGSGSTHMGLKYGCATMIVPHIIDQFVWNKVVSDLGAGPKGPDINKVKMETMEPKILDLWTNASYKEMAMEIAGQMKKEDFRQQLVEEIIDSPA